MHKEMKLIFPAENGMSFSPNDSTYLLFIDETGEENLSDPNFPIFGFGAVGLPVSLYVSNIVKPWIYIKGKAFGGEAQNMHAADLHNPSGEQLKLLNKFFTSCAFCRIGSILSDKTAFECHTDIYNLSVRMFYSRVIDVLKHTSFSNIYMIFEDSQRNNPLNKDYFSRYKFHKKGDSGESIEVGCEKFIMSKNEREPGLEVADFIAHTAGASVHSRLKGIRSKDNERKDFQAIFQSGDKRLSSFLEITRVKK
jgi:hypothetical protein